MPRFELQKDTTPPQSKQIQFLENKVNRLRWVNDDLNRQIFDAIQRGHRLAAKLGYQDLNDAEAALATQAGGEAAQTQLEQLSQHSSEELASHVQALQSELASHVQLSKTTLSALGDALAEMTELREENEKLREELAKARTKGESKAEATRGKDVKHEADSAEAPSSPPADNELVFVKAEFAKLKGDYTALLKAKHKSDDKHSKDYKSWKKFKQWLWDEVLEADEERDPKRRKLNLPDDDDAETKEGAVAKGKREILSRLRKGLRDNPDLGPLILSRMPDLDPPTSDEQPPVLTSRNLNSSSSPPPSDIATPSKPGDVPCVSLKVVKHASVVIPGEDGPGSSDTEPEGSQPVAFVYPSQLEVTAIPIKVPQKRPRSPVQDHDSSDTEQESQVATFLFASQIDPLTPAQLSEMALTERTPKLGQTVRRCDQLWTPVSAVRPKAGRAKAKRPALTHMPPPGSPSRSDPFSLASRSGSDSKSLPETPMSRPMKKGKERATANDENTPASTSTSASTKKHVADYSIYKGRGRYGAEAQAGKETINALFEIDPERNGGVGFQFEEVVRDKEKRKQMHGGDCECCREYYKAVGPMPSRLQPPMWRSPESSPSKKPVRISFGDGDEDDSSAAIEQHKNAISRHRQQWERSKTPPGYWNIGFPDTQEVDAMNAEARRMHDRKRALVEEEAERGGKYRKR